MATASGDFYGEYAKQSRLRLHWEYTQEPSNNRDYFVLTLYAEKPSGTGTHSYNYHDSIYIITGLSDNQLINGTGDWYWGNVTEYYVGSSSFYNYHNVSGVSDNVSISGAWITGLSSSSVIGQRMEVYGTVTNIPTIPRYLDNLYQSQRSKTVNSISINWSCSPARDWTQYSVNGGSWKDAYDTVASNNMSGYYTISNLQPNTTYSIKTRCRRQDSGLWTETSAMSVTTYDIAKISTANNFNLGSNETITYSNPSSTTIAVAIYKTDGSTPIRAYQSASGSSYTFTFTDAELDTLYKMYGENTTISVRFYIRTTANGVSYWNYKTTTITITGNQKTGHINVDGTWKRTKKWVNVGGTWKRCVRWVNVGGTWKRCI